jgi:hypothetical protein
MFAALLLLISSIAGFDANQKVYSSGQDTIPSAPVEKAQNDSLNDAVKHKADGLKLGLLLFRHG